ncbi:hypothetical protein L1887_01879 [Cichorium endivia]|nr:hypothetical protein L1887_01879 [Cichorium endivia]
MRRHYLELFTRADFWDEIQSSGGRIVRPVPPRRGSGGSTARLGRNLDSQMTGQQGISDHYEFTTRTGYVGDAGTGKPRECAMIVIRRAKLGYSRISARLRISTDACSLVVVVSRVGLLLCPIAVLVVGGADLSVRRACSESSGVGGMGFEPD